jgi:4-hydroxythreonine-4-phosphate dehydrogenase
MLMVAGGLRVGLVTTHMALKDVPGAMTIEKIHGKIKAFEQSLRKDFGIRRPKIAVLGLNPHAGENGKMGDEEHEVIAPSISKSKNEGIMAFGPYPADSFFGSSNRFNFDGILAMFHDQGLSAFKAIAFDEGVNFTAGLPVVRTSPDHGTAFDIAGKDEASGASMRQAIYLAMDVYRNHQLEKEINANPLEITPPKEYDRDRDRKDGRRSGPKNGGDKSRSGGNDKKREPPKKDESQETKPIESKEAESKPVESKPVHLKAEEPVKESAPKVEKEPQKEGAPSKSESNKDKD